jgi:serine/threonine protein phosphatase PrpC
MKKVVQEDLLRVLGKNLSHDWVSNEPEFRVWELKEEDEYILLSTSGLFEVLNPEEILTLINMEIRNVPILNPKEILQGVFNEYYKRGGMANAGAILIDTLHLK